MKTTDPANGGKGIGPYPEASAPDPHVPLLHYVIEIGSHPGEPVTPGSRAHAPRVALGRAEGRGRRRRGGLGPKGRALGRQLCVASERAHRLRCAPKPGSARPARSHFGGARGARRCGAERGVS